MPTHLPQIARRSSVPIARVPTPAGHWLMVAVVFTLMVLISALAFHFDGSRSVIVNVASEASLAN